MKLLHADATPRFMAIWRVYLLSVFALWMADNDWSLLAWVPREQFRPMGIFQIPFLFDFLFNAGVLRGLQVAGFCLAVLGILNIWTRWSVLLVTLLNLTYYRMVVSMEYNTHRGLGVIFGGLILAGALFCEHRDRSRGIARTNYAPVVLQLSTLVVLVSYSLVGVHRIAFGGLESLRADYLLSWFIERGGDGTYEYGLQIQDHPRLLRMLELGLPVFTLVEALAPFALVSRTFKWVFVVIVFPFHFMALYLMNIFFWQNLLILPVLLFNLSFLYHARLADRSRTHKSAAVAGRTA